MSLPFRTALPRAVLVLSLTAYGAAAQQTAAPATPAPEESADRVVISVGEQQITAADVEKFLEALPPQHRLFYSTGQGRQLLPQYLIRMKVLSAEARQQKLEEDPEVREAIAIATESILSEAARKRIAESIPIPEEQIQKLYEEQQTQYEEVRLRRLLLRTETSILGQSMSPTKPPLSSAEARKKLEDLRRQILEDGADFAELAQAYSDDLATAGAGGDMGYMNRQTVVPPVWEAARALEPGQVSEIIPTPYGLELIQVADKRVKPLSEVREQLEAQARQAEVEARIQQLLGQYKVTIDNAFFAPPPAPPPTPTTKP